ALVDTVHGRQRRADAGRAGGEHQVLHGGVDRREGRAYVERTLGIRERHGDVRHEDEHQGRRLAQVLGQMARRGPHAREARLLGGRARRWPRAEQRRLVAIVRAAVDLAERAARRRIGHHQELPRLDVAAARRLGGGADAGHDVRVGHGLVGEAAHGARGGESLEEIHHSIAVSASRPSRMRPASSSVAGATITCCVATWMSRKQRWSGLAAYTAVPPPAPYTRSTAHAEASVAWVAASRRRARSRISIAPAVCARSQAPPTVSARKARAAPSVASARATSAWMTGRSARRRRLPVGVLAPASATSSSSARRAMPSATAAMPRARRPKTGKA